MKPEPSPDLTFEDAIDQLERIAADLEQGAPELAEALASYEQAVRLLAHCHGLLDGAERTIALLPGVDDRGEPVPAPFDATATAEREPAPPAPKTSKPTPRTRSKPSPTLLPDPDDSSPP